MFFYYDKLVIKKISTLRVSPEFQGIGIGQNLLNWARFSLHCTSPLVTVPQVHYEAFAKLFERNGFILCKEYHDYYKKGGIEFFIMVICQNQRKDSWHKMRDCILISIKPVYAEAILNGVKTVEYRRCHFSSVIRKMLIYETSPLQKIVGEVFVREIIYESPDYIW